jgi:hypothetical protein
MNRTFRFLVLAGSIGILILVLSACAAAATEAPTHEVAPAPTEIPVEAPENSPAPAAEASPSPLLPPTLAPVEPAETYAAPTQFILPTVAPSQAEPTSPTALAQFSEQRLVEVEFPARIRLGESDIIRMALLPYQDGYILTTEYPEHQIITQTVLIERPGGYDLFAVARLDSVNFKIAPEGDQEQYLPPETTITWRWTLTPDHSGTQRLSILLKFHWVPQPGNASVAREVVAYSSALQIEVISFLGLTQPQAIYAALLGLLAGGSLSAVAIFLRPRQKQVTIPLSPEPNQALDIELPPGLNISPTERLLLQTLFHRYARLVIEREFLSGYSGARAFLTQPIRSDGRADAFTIAKLGDSESIRREFINYETYVKDTLPPITARIQHPPVVLPERSEEGKGSQQSPGLPGKKLAALRYTFIGEPGANPTSLRQALLAQTDPILINKLFDTFGPNWWMQRRPYTFRLAAEYDRLLPTHLVLEPSSGKGILIDGEMNPAELAVQPGDRVVIRNFSGIELRRDAESLSLQGAASPGQPALRLRWLARSSPEGATGRVVATRQTLLQQATAAFDRLGLPDPLLQLPALMNETVHGSQATIHGDLNLENVLIGPGGIVWLIDFAQTREGHTLLDFAHLETETIAHIMAPRILSGETYLGIFQSLENPDTVSYPGEYAEERRLLESIHTIAYRCLFNPSHLREYSLALAITCLGAMKYTNLNPHQKHLLYLTAAYLLQGS